MQVFPSVKQFALTDAEFDGFAADCPEKIADNDVQRTIKAQSIFEKKSLPNENNPVFYPHFCGWCPAIEKINLNRKVERNEEMMQELDSSQRKFCDAHSGNNIRLLAPAGCGKTLCLLFRCKQLAERSLHSSRPRFLIVTFTRAAAGELRYRVNSDDRFLAIRNLVEISTLNKWGFRRVKSVAAVNPKLLKSGKDYHFTMLNQLQPIWQKHKHIKKR